MYYSHRNWIRATEPQTLRTAAYSVMINVCLTGNYSQVRCYTSEGLVWEIKPGLACDTSFSLSVSLHPCLSFFHFLSISLFFPMFQCVCSEWNISILLCRLQGKTLNFCLGKVDFLERRKCYLPNQMSITTK